MGLRRCVLFVEPLHDIPKLTVIKLNIKEDFTVWLAGGFHLLVIKILKKLDLVKLY